jgi:Protein of unknown function (DUF2948)
MLKLRALDADDLSVISTQMQDALIRVSDMRLDSRRQFACVANRFAWDALPDKQRRRTGLHFEHVTKAARQGFRNTSTDAILSLLNISFTPTDAPSGKVTLTFSGGHTVVLEVEYIAAAMRDLGPAWKTASEPKHG